MAIIRNRVNGFTPALNGLHFDNVWPHVPDWRIHISGGRTLSIGDASLGMCGGMSHTVRDLFEAGLLPPADRVAPASGPLFDYIAARLLDSYDLPDGPLEYIGAMSPLLPDLARSTIIRQGWLDVRHDIDAQRLSPIGIIKIRSALITDIGENHQCLVFGYELDGSQLTLHTYDPNNHDQDITLMMDVRAETILIASSDGTDAFSFFRTNYHPVFPAPLVGAGDLRHRLGVADVVFAADDRQVHHLALQAGTGWQTWALGGPAAAGPPFEYVTTTFDPATRVIWRGDDGHIQQVALSDGGDWTASDLCALAPGAADAAGDPYGYVTEAFDPAARVVYRGADGHIHELSLAPDGTWTPADLFAFAAGAVEAAGDPHAYVTDDFQLAARVVYRGVDGHVHELSLAPDGSWVPGDLFEGTAGAVEAAGDPHGYVTDSFEQAARVVYRGVDGHIHELSLLPDGGSWEPADLSLNAGAPIDAAGDPHAYVTDVFDPAARVVYRGTDGHVHELSLAPGGGWAHGDLFDQPGALPRAVSDPHGYSTVTIDRAARVVYLGGDGHIHELFLTPNVGWANGDLTAASVPLGGLVTAGGPPRGCATALNI